MFEAVEGLVAEHAEGMRIAAALDPSSDVMVSWLPLFHDMGMVGFLTIPMTVGLDLVSVTPTAGSVNGSPLVDIAVKPV